MAEGGGYLIGGLAMLHVELKNVYVQCHQFCTFHVNLRQRSFPLLSSFRKIRYFIKKWAAIRIYEFTILPLLEYADFICDQGIAYVNKITQKLQNMGLSKAFNQHIITVCPDGL